MTAGRPARPPTETTKRGRHGARRLCDPTSPQRRGRRSPTRRRAAIVPSIAMTRAAGDDPPRAHRGGPLMAAPAPFVHRAVLYGDEAEGAQVVVARLHESVGRGESAVAVLGPRLRRTVEDLLGADAPAVHFRDLRDVHAESVDAMIANYLGMVDGLRQRGGRLSSVVEYDPGHPHDGTGDFCYRLEREVGIAAAERPADNTCLYDLRAVSGEEVAAARRTHPLLVVGGVEGPNPDLGDGSAPALVVIGRAALGALRHWVRERAADLPPGVLAELVLVATEAVTAVVETGTGVWVGLDRARGGYALRVSWPARLPRPDEAVLRTAVPPDDPLHGLSLAVRSAPAVSVGWGPAGCSRSRCRGDGPCEHRRDRSPARPRPDRVRRPRPGPVGPARRRQRRGHDLRRRRRGARRRRARGAARRQRGRRARRRAGRPGVRRRARPVLRRRVRRAGRGGVGGPAAGGADLRRARGRPPGAHRGGVRGVRGRARAVLAGARRHGRVPLRRRDRPRRAGAGVRPARFRLGEVAAARAPPAARAAGPRGGGRPVQRARPGRRRHRGDG
ncbi:hypothetical protein HOP40_22130 [Pseudonocardia broussonetiae]|uniref:MEDS domain-containing protein n=1 Tax=Pseudonocardia broussonetiae TaxID=2736640 RepID=A0A6M6JTR1_9PSEU|nr:hypothetical protein HOP40_22130 [Pseudonocardia broussonetiae]